MRLLLDPPDVPHWAASINREWTVSRSDVRDSDGTNLYIVKHFVREDGWASAGELRKYMIRDRWIGGFLKQLCKMSGLTDVSIVTDPSASKHEALYRYVAPAYMRKTRRAA